MNITKQLTSSITNLVLSEIALLVKSGEIQANDECGIHLSINPQKELEVRVLKKDLDIKNKYVSVKKLNTERVIDSIEF